MLSSHLFVVTRNSLWLREISVFHDAKRTSWRRWCSLVLIRSRWVFSAAGPHLVRSHRANQGFSAMHPIGCDSGIPAIRMPNTCYARHGQSSYFSRAPTASFPTLHTSISSNLPKRLPLVEFNRRKHTQYLLTQYSYVNVRPPTLLGPTFSPLGKNVRVREAKLQCSSLEDG